MNGNMSYSAAGLRDNGRRCSGIDRRQFSYLRCIPWVSPITSLLYTAIVSYWNFSKFQFCVRILKWNQAQRAWLCLCPLEGGFIRFFAFPKFFGVLEWWCSGKIRLFYSLTRTKLWEALKAQITSSLFLKPTLQHSSTPTLHWLLFPGRANLL